MHVIEPNDNDTYESYINRIKESNREITDCYTEKHHIIPKCMGGTNTSKNIVVLLPQEHYYAHKLMAVENPHNNKLQYAWWLLASIKGRRHIYLTPDEYAEVRENFVKTLEGNDKFYKAVRSKSHSENVSKSRRANKSHWYTNGIEELIIKEVDPVPDGFVRGRLHPSEETIKKMSNARAGKPANNKGKPMTEEQKRVLSASMKKRYERNRNSYALVVYNAKPVIEVTTNTEYCSIQEAFRQTGVSIHFIHKSIERSIEVNGLLFKLKGEK